MTWSVYTSLEYLHNRSSLGLVVGFEVGSQYTRYLLDGEEPNWDRLKQYNSDDVTNST